MNYRPSKLQKPFYLYRSAVKSTVYVLQKIRHDSYVTAVFFLSAEQLSLLLLTYLKLLKKYQSEFTQDVI